MRRLLAGLRWLLLTELRMYVGALRLLTRRTDVPEGATAHSYAGAASALLWGFTAVSAVELVVVHLIVPWEGVRLALDILGIWGVVWCFGLTACHYVYPHLLTSAALRVRAAGRTDKATLPLAGIAGVVVRERSHEGSRSVVLEQPGVVAVAVAGRTNVDVRLSPPVTVVVRGRPEQVHEVQMFCDEPREVAVALRAAIASGAR